MSNLLKEFRQQIFNESGYVLELPSFAVDEEMLQSATIDPYSQTVKQLFPPGTKITNGIDVWRYTKNGAGTLVIGSPTQSAVEVHTDASYDIVTTGAPAIGDTYVNLTSTGNIDVAPWVTKDGGKDGYVFVNGGTGAGQMRKIKGHEAFVTTGVTRVDVYDGWTIALVAGSSECGLVQHPFKNVIVAGTAATEGHCTGIPLIAVTAEYWYWSKTGGPAPALCNAAIAVGTYAVIGTTAGKIDPASAVTTELIIGYMITAGIKSGDYAPIFLTLDS